MSTPTGASAVPAGFDAVFLSPHLDDVAFSCGAQIHARTRRGERVLIVTVFAGMAPPRERLSSFAAHLHGHWGLDGRDAVEARRAEDRRAVAALGADALHLDFSDAIYRTDARGEPLYATLASLFLPARDEDSPLEERLRAALADLPPSPFVAAPLAIGAHVDHLLVQRAARATVAPERLWLYEDFPYAESWRVRRRVTARLGGWATRIEVVTGESAAAKCRAIECYASQHDATFLGDALARRVQRFHRRRGGERLWQAPH